MAEPIAYEILPGKRPRKNESSVTTYKAIAGAIAIGLYLRLSLAKTTAKIQADALERQDATEAVEAEGACVTRTYCDPDHSAEKRSVVRPGFDQMVSDLKAGLIKGIAIGDIDRLTRRHGILEMLIEIYEINQELADKGKAERLYFYCYHDPQDNRAPVDLRTPEGRREARKRVDAAYEEIQVMKMRQTKRHNRCLKDGTMVGARNYGYTTAGAIIEEEAEAIRLLADAVDTGKKLQPVLDSLNAGGLTNKRGKPFTHRTAHAVLQSPRIIGLRVNGKADDLIARDDNGNPIVGNQPAILDGPEGLAQWHRIQDAYRGRQRGSTMRAYLGSGVFVCTCGATMNGGWQKSLRRHRYVCPANRGDNCGKNTLHGPKVDEYLRQIVRLELAKDAPPVAEPEPWPDQVKLDAIIAKREEAKDRRTAGTLDVETWLDIDGSFAEAIGGLRKDRKAWLIAHPVQTDSTLETLAQRWEEGDTDQQRSVILRLLRGVVADPDANLAVEDRLFPIPCDD